MKKRTADHALVRVFAKQRSIVQGGLDASAWIVGLTFGTVVRYDFDIARVEVDGLVLVAAIACLAQWVAGTAFGLYIGRWRFGSFDEVAALVRASGVVTAFLFVVVYFTAPRIIPLSATLSGGVTALVVMGGSRYGWRLVLERMRRPAGDGLKRLLVFGAGEGGTQIVTSMLRDPSSPYLPVALLDDSRLKRHLRVMGVPVVGTRHAIADAARRFRADALLVAIPSAGSELLKDLSDIATEAGLEVRVLPPLGELLGIGPDVADIRPLTEADLLGRHEVRVDLPQIAGYLRGKRVLVTGAGGSIGSELCRQIARFSPAELVMLDRDESALHAVQLSIDGEARLDSPSVVLCDIRERDRVAEVFDAHRPEVVFHAAALKHVPILEAHPEEAVKTNVWGTLHVLEAAHDSGVKRFVNISTDKAADPVNVLGYTKRICERLTAHYADVNGGTYLSVRFGNVLGSRGSVLETFRAQVEAGGPVTVTDPEATRFFMTIVEAVQLVIQAAVIGERNEVLVLDMGLPVRIADVAHRLAAQGSPRVDVRYTGLRPGEKLHEVLVGSDENGVRKVHPQILHVGVPSLEPHALVALDSGVRAALPVLCGNASPDRR